MVDSEVAICNEALYLVGVTQDIDSLDESTLEAKVCNRFYARSRDLVLEAFAWPFAMRRADLAELDVERDDWDYVYALPSDCIAPRSILIDGVPVPLSSDRIEFKIEANDAGDGKVLLSNLEDATLAYTARITNVAAFPDSFVSAVTWNLVSWIVLPLTKKPELRKGATEEYRYALAEAVASANRQEFLADPVTPTLAARGALRRLPWKRWP